MTDTTGHQDHQDGGHPDHSDDPATGSGQDGAEDVDLDLDVDGEYDDARADLAELAQELVTAGAGRALLVGRAGQQLQEAAEAAAAPAAARFAAGLAVDPGVTGVVRAGLLPAQQFAAQTLRPAALWQPSGVHAATLGAFAGARLTPMIDAIQEMFRPPLLDFDLGRYVFGGGVDLGWPWIDQLYPSGSILPAVLRPLDLARPLLPDLSAVFRNLVDVTAITEGLWRDPELWRLLEDTGSRVTLNAVRRAWNAALKFGPDALGWFVRDWLDRKPTPPRLEATCDALLHLDWDELPRTGLAALRYLRARVVERYRTARLLLNTPLRGGLIESSDSLVSELPDTSWAGVEDVVLDALEPEPISDPRLHALLARLTSADQQIVLLKSSVHCSWAAAAEHHGRDRAYGEVLRRRLDRWRTRLGTHGTTV